MRELRRKSRRYKKKMIKGAKKTFIALVFAPLWMPKMTASMVSTLMRFCEAAALLFTTLLVAHMAAPDVVATFLVYLSGLLFVGLLLAIKFSDYQEKIEQYKYFGFRI